MFDLATATAEAAETNPQIIEAPALVPGLELHLDGDYLAYYASGNEDCTAGQARINAMNVIEKFRSLTGSERIVVHNTASGSQKGERYLIATVKPYQGKRSGSKPKNHAYLQDWLQCYEGHLFRAKNWASREADDGIGACAHYAIGRGPGYAAIATADKDMRMLPGLHVSWKPVDDEHVLTRVMPGDYDVLGKDGKQYGLKWFFMQMVMGDTTDNIPGLEGIRNTKGDGFKTAGEGAAIKVLADALTATEAAEAVALYYRDFYGGDWADRYVEQAALLWMRCDTHAAVTDFVDHKGHSRIAYPSDIYDAAQRLQERVTLARATLNSQSNQVDPLCSISIAA